MNQPLAITLTQKAPTISLSLGAVVVVALIIYPFWLCCLRIIHWQLDLHLNAGRQDSLLCDSRYRTGFSLGICRITVTWAWSALLLVAMGWDVPDGKRQVMDCRRLCLSCHGRNYRGFRAAANTLSGHCA